MYLIKTLVDLEHSGVITLGRGKIISKKDLENQPGSYPVYSSSKIGTGKFGEYGRFMFDEELITWSVDGGGKLFHRGKHKFSITNVTGFLRILKPDVLQYKYLFYVLSYLHSKVSFDWVKKAHPSVLRKMYTHIPILPLAEQQRIVAKLDAAFAEIDDMLKISKLKLSEASNIPFNLIKKILDDDTYEWTLESLSGITKNLDAMRIPITKSKRIEGTIPYYGASGIVDYVNDFIFDDDLLLVSEDGANLLARTYPIAFSIEGKTWVNNHAHVLKFEDRKLQKWVEYYLNSTNISSFISGMAQPKLNQKKLNEIPIPCPKPHLLSKLLSKLEQVGLQSESLVGIETQKIKQIDMLKSAILTQELNPSKTA